MCRSVAEQAFDVGPHVRGAPRGSLRPGPEAAMLMKFGRLGDPEAFRALCERHQVMVFGVCHRLLGDVDDAKEATTKCFVKLVREAGELRAPVARIGSVEWLFTRPSIWPARDGRVTDLRVRYWRRTVSDEQEAGR